MRVWWAPSGSLDSQFTVFNGNRHHAADSWARIAGLVLLQVSWYGARRAEWLYKIKCSAFSSFPFTEYFTNTSDKEDSRGRSKGGEYLLNVLACYQACYETNPIKRSWEHFCPILRSITFKLNLVNSKGRTRRHCYYRRFCAVHGCESFKWYSIRLYAVWLLHSWPCQLPSTSLFLFLELKELPKLSGAMADAKMPYSILSRPLHFGFFLSRINNQYEVHLPSIQGFE